LIHGEKEGMEFMKGELEGDFQVLMGERRKTITLD
jgi:hypothetical protein